MLWIAYCGAPAFSAVSVTTIAELNVPAEVGAKLRDNRHDWSAPSEPAGDPLPITGHAVPPLAKLKLTGTEGLLPLPGAGNERGALPMFSSVIVWGLSLLVDPGAVEAKLRA